MKTLFNLLSKSQYGSSFICSRLFSSKQYKKIEGLPANFNEFEVRLYFNDWLKSLWLAPNQWIYSTRDQAITVTRRFLPFWNINFQGTIECSLSTKSNFPFRHDESYYSHKEWHKFPLSIANISLNNINIYAAEKFDKYHVQKLDVSFDDVQLMDLTNKNNIIEKPTIDRETAFNHAWILIIKPLLENNCLEEAKKMYPTFEEPRIDSFHLKINSKEENLLYYPIYIINYKYNSRMTYTCLFDGITGHITGDRQYSMTKVTFATLIAFYPMLKIALFCFGSLANLLFAFEIAADLSLSVSLPMALIIAPCVGLYARLYPKLYKKDISQVQWKRDESKALNFTYEFIDSVQQQKKHPALEDSQPSSDSSLINKNIKKQDD